MLPSLTQVTAPRLAAPCTPREHVLGLTRLSPIGTTSYFRIWPFTSFSQFGPCPLLVEPDIAIRIDP
jgi:hypothetical protein